MLGFGQVILHVDNPLFERMLASRTGGLWRPTRILIGALPIDGCVDGLTVGHSVGSIGATLTRNSPTLGSSILVTRMWSSTSRILSLMNFSTIAIIVAWLKMNWL